MSVLKLNMKNKTERGEPLILAVFLLLIVAALVAVAWGVSHPDVKRGQIKEIGWGFKVFH